VTVSVTSLDLGQNINKITMRIWPSQHLVFKHQELCSYLFIVVSKGCGVGGKKGIGVAQGCHGHCYNQSVHKSTEWLSPAC
jgi:hypothetical protein